MNLYFEDLNNFHIPLDQVFQSLHNFGQILKLN